MRSSQFQHAVRWMRRVSSDSSFVSSSNVSFANRQRQVARLKHTDVRSMTKTINRNASTPGHARHCSVVITTPPGPMVRQQNFVNLRARTRGQTLLEHSLLAYPTPLHAVARSQLAPTQRRRRWALSRLLGGRCPGWLGASTLRESQLEGFHESSGLVGPLPLRLLAPRTIASCRPQGHSSACELFFRNCRHSRPMRGREQPYETA